MTEKDRNNPIMKSVQKMREKIYFWIAFLFVLVELIWLHLISYEKYLNSDIAGSILSAYIGTLEKSLYPQGYNYTSALGFESHTWFMQPFIYIGLDLKTSFILSSILLLLVYAILCYFMLKSFSCGNMGCCIGMVVLTIPFSSYILEQHCLHQFYLIQLMGMYFTIFLFNNIVNIKNRTYVVMIIINSFLFFLQGTAGSRFIAQVCLPFAMVGVYVVWLIVKEKIHNNKWEIIYIKKAFFLLCSGIGALWGYSLYVTHFSKNYSSYARLLETSVITNEMLLERIKLMVERGLSFFGAYFVGGNLVSLNGIYVCLAYMAIISSVLILIRFWKKISYSNDIRLKCVFVLGITALLSGIVQSVILSSVIPAGRYIYIAGYVLLVIIILYFAQCKKGINEIIEQFSETSILIIFVMYIAVGNIYVLKQANQFGKEFSNARKQVNEFLIDNGYQYGYTEYWNSNVGTVLSENKIKYNALSFTTDQIYPWFGGMPRYKVDKNSGKVFVLLTKEETEKYIKNLPAGYNKVYENIWFDVYDYASNPFNFNAELLQYFPVTNEEIVLTNEDFFTQGIVLNGEIVSNKEFDGFLIYGPYLNFPVNGVYNIEYCIDVHEKNSSNIGYVAVTSDIGGKTIEKTQIICDSMGEMSVQLENVIISSENTFIELPIFIYQGNEVTFKCIKVTRIK